MTISSTVSRVAYSGNDSTTEFAFAYLFPANGDLVVTLRGTNGAETVQTITTHYTVSGAGDAGGGTVTMVSAPATGEKLIIDREIAATQGVDLVENDDFPSQTVEDALDRAMMVAQRLDTELGRSIRITTSITDGPDLTINKVAADRASKLVAFDASGDLSVDQEIGTFQGDWATATVYTLRDLVESVDAATLGNIYICVTAHTGGTFATDLAAAKWVLILEIKAANDAQTAAETAQTAAETAQTAAELAETNAETAQTAAELAETNAETAQTAAELAETNAETAETNAETAQTAAELAETNAETAETNAAASAAAAAASAAVIDLTAPGEIGGVTPNVVNATQAVIDNVTIDGNSLISTDTNGDLNVTPDGTGDLVLDGLKWPQADGTADYVLKTNGTAQLSWVAQSAVGVALGDTPTWTGAHAWASPATTGNGLSVVVDSLTSGNGVRVYSNSAFTDTGTNGLLTVHADNASAAANAFRLTNDGTGITANFTSNNSTALKLDQNSNHTALNIDSEATTAHAFAVDGANTTSSLVQLTTTSLTSGNVINIYSNAQQTDTGTNAVLNINNDHASAAAVAVRIKNDGSASILDTQGASGSFNVLATGNCENTNGVYGTISDETLKDVGEHPGSKLDLAIQLSEIMTEYTLRGGDGTVLLGWVAQQVQAIAPSLVYVSRRDQDTGRDILGVKTSVIHLIIAQEFGPLARRVAALEAR